MTNQSNLPFRKKEAKKNKAPTLLIRNTAIISLIKWNFCKIPATDPRPPTHTHKRLRHFVARGRCTFSFRKTRITDIYRLTALHLFTQIAHLFYNFNIVRFAQNKIANFCKCHTLCAISFGAPKSKIYNLSDNYL